MCLFPHIKVQHIIKHCYALLRRTSILYVMTSLIEQKSSLKLMCGFFWCVNRKESFLVTYHAPIHPPPILCVICAGWELLGF